jgi:hypothetical protein
MEPFWMHCNPILFMQRSLKNIMLSLSSVKTFTGTDVLRSSTPKTGDLNRAQWNMFVDSVDSQGKVGEQRAKCAHSPITLSDHSRTLIFHHINPSSF